MTQSQQIVDELFGRLLAGERVPPQGVDLLRKIQARLSESGEIEGELRQLYHTVGCGELALRLLWVSDRAASEGRNQPTEEEETQFVAGVEEFLLSQGLVMPAEPAVPQEFSGEIPASEPEFSSSESIPDEAEVEPTASPSESAGALGESVGFDPATMGQLLDQFLESVQAGGEDGAVLLDQLRVQCQACLSAGAADPVVQRYSASVDDFLGYIQENNLLEDVRVMNIVTNIQDPFAQWLSAAGDAREGILEQGIEFLTDFRAMFE